MDVALSAAHLLARCQSRCGRCALHPGPRGSHPRPREDRAVCANRHRHRKATWRMRRDKSAVSRTHRLRSLRVFPARVSRVSVKGSEVAFPCVRASRSRASTVAAHMRCPPCSCQGIGAPSVLVHVLALSLVGRVHAMSISTQGNRACACSGCLMPP